METIRTDDDLISSKAEYAARGETLTAFLCRPKTGGPFPGLILIQEWWGVNDHIKEIARRLAKEGYTVLAPDLYSRLGNVVTKNAAEAAKLMAALAPDRTFSDLAAGLEYLKNLSSIRRSAPSEPREREGEAPSGFQPQRAGSLGTPAMAGGGPQVGASLRRAAKPKGFAESKDASPLQSKIGVIGFCMGGSYALGLACRTSELRAAVAFYGEIPADAELRKLSAPLLFFWGEEDGWIRKEEVQRLKEALKKHKKTGEVRTYPGAPHAFFNDTRREVYQPKAAKDAWRRSLDFFNRYLKS